MRFLYRFKEDPFGDLSIVLPDEISIFSDFIENIATEEQVDEYIEYAEKVLEGSYDHFEIELNATSVFIKKDVTIVENPYRFEEPFENSIQTEEFIKLLLVWKKKIPEIFKG
ncbi:tRNA-Val4 [Metabacillus malikii]|uniref:tRNA-Val4 n=1 Tax=Metabacillus malikii TaxID=1504265 RepID=A0ABT9ZPI0_9BACI|nr:tRNA-Val4 [Metabacillus malikii]MDQ0233418.1 hypothetical protein [Metabacillus malikii]